MNKRIPWGSIVGGVFVVLSLAGYLWLVWPLIVRDFNAMFRR